mgnify:CR=1 FL=1|tara:strand:+ start:81 stop:383 length:303 start_codon:yes stop_codon:yes gene_type:complete
MSSTKTLSVLSELDVHLSITKNGIAVVISADDAETSFSEYNWDELLDDMVEQHSIPVLASNDYKISKDSANFIVDASQKMRSAARELVQRITNMDIIDIG